MGSSTLLMLEDTENGEDDMLIKNLMRTALSKNSFGTIPRLQARFPRTIHAQRFVEYIGPNLARTALPKISFGNIPQGTSSYSGKSSDRLTREAREDEFYEKFVAHLSEKGQWPQVAEKASKRLLETLAADKRDIDDQWVLVGYGGGKDSTYMSAFVRFLQLYTRKMNLVGDGKTFNVRYVTNLQGGILPSVLKKIDNIYSSMAIDGDPKSQAIGVVGNQVIPYKDIAGGMKGVDRVDGKRILMAGHQNYGLENRANFCDSCNVAMVNGFDKGVTPGSLPGIKEELPPASMLITGDSLPEIRAYANWPLDVAQRVGIPKDTRPHNLVLNIGNHIGGVIHGKSNPVRYSPNTKTNPAFFTIYQDTPYEVSDHREFIENLGFSMKEKDLAVAFTESDCFHPLAMAHFFALSMEHLSKTGKIPNLRMSYDEATTFYIDNHIVPLMKEKQIPQDIIDMNLRRYATPEKRRETRGKVENLLFKKYGYTRESIDCMIQSPFVEQGKNLDTYLSRTYPSLGEAERSSLSGAIKSVLEGKSENGEMKKLLESQSGLKVEELQHIFGQKCAEPILGKSRDEVAKKFSSSSHYMNIMRGMDPHKRILPLPNNMFLHVTGRYSTLARFGALANGGYVYSSRRCRSTRKERFSCCFPNRRFPILRPAMKQEVRLRSNLGGMQGARQM